MRSILFYIAMREQATFDRKAKRPGKSVYSPLVTHSRPHFHKTYAGAQRRAGTHGKVAILDFANLPQVIEEQGPTLLSRLSDAEFAERQMLAWGAIADRLRRKDAA